MLSNLGREPAKAGRWDSGFFYHTPSVEGDLRMIKLSWWSPSPEKRKREIAHKRYWDHKEAYISLLLRTSFLLIIIPALYFPPADAAGGNIALYKQMSTHFDCLTMLRRPWSSFCCPTSTKCIVGMGTRLLFFLFICVRLFQVFSLGLLTFYHPAAFKQLTSGK